MQSNFLGDTVRLLTDFTYKQVGKVFKKEVDTVKGIIMGEYDDKLVDVAAGIDSKSNPALYRAEFKQRLNDFDFVEETRNGYVLNTPDITTFNFSGRLQIIKTILAGVVGEYIEMDINDYASVFKVLPVKIDSGDSNLSDEVDMVVLRYNSDIRRAEAMLNKKFNPYPFSNAPPIEIFKSAEDYVDKNISRWVNKAKDLALKEFKKSFRGAVRI